MLQIIHKERQSYTYLAKSFQIFPYLTKNNVLLAEGVIIELILNVHPDLYQHKGIYAETMQVVQPGFFPAYKTCTRKWELLPTRLTARHICMWFSMRYTVLSLYTCINVGMLLHHYKTQPCSICFPLLMSSPQKPKWKTRNNYTE